MRRVWDGIIGLLVTLFIVNALVQMLRPYAWLMAIAVVVAFMSQRAYNRFRRW